MLGSAAGIELGVPLAPPPPARPRTDLRRELGEEEGGEVVVAHVVGAPLQLEALRGAVQRVGHDAGVEDQEVDRRAGRRDVGGKGLDAAQVSQVQLLHGDAALERAAGGEVGGHRLPRLHAARAEHDGRTRRRQRAHRLHANAWARGSQLSAPR